MDDCLRGWNLRALGGGVDSPEVVGEAGSVEDCTFPSTSWSGRGPAETEGLSGAAGLIGSLGVCKEGNGVGVVNVQVRIPSRL